MCSGPHVQMDALKEASRDDPTAWRDYRSPKNRTYWWNEAKNSSGATAASASSRRHLVLFPAEVIPNGLCVCHKRLAWVQGMHGAGGVPDKMPHWNNPRPAAQCGCCLRPSPFWTLTTTPW